ncbi:MAG TPA: glycoside hydrolase family 3 N-terminal domain-containing protein [Solirubrobacteraceae bacterium]|nr:glycoside hydrolase family 3 N-terminal domain-containing protein [Solirubrobacteraceae bacterium]
MDGLSLKQQLGQLVVLRFAGTELPGYVKNILSDGWAAGAILFADNITGPDQAKALAADIQEAAGGDALVMTDQEGGTIRNLDWLGPQRSAPAQGSPAAVRAAHREAGAGLRDHGITVALAPVADVPVVGGSVMTGRAFSADPKQAAARVAAAVEGLGQSQVAATLKHFPGLGGATVNTDDGPATVDRSEEELTGSALEPFRAGIEAGARLVMLGSARYPALDDERIAMLSPAVVDGLLRDELGFDGVAITDSLEADAVTDVAEVDEAAVEMVEAGGDIALTTGRGSWIRVFRAFEARADASPAFRERVRESAARVLELKRSLGLDAPG